MPRNITLTFEDGGTHVYNNVPDTVTPADIETRATTEFSGRKLTGIDGGGTGQPKLATTGIPGLKNRLFNSQIPEQPPAYDPKAQWGSGTPKVAYEVGGKVTDITGSPAAGMAANVAVEAVPALFGGSVGKTAAPVFRAAAERLMSSALKPTLKQHQTGEAAVAVNTMLDQGINATAGGAETLQSKIDVLNNEISTLIANSNAKIDKHAVASRLNDLFPVFQKQVNPAADMNTITNAWTEFLTHPELLGKVGFPVQLAQEMKQATYQVLKKKYGQLGSADVEAQKTLARGLKEEIAVAEPQVAALNAQESDLIKTLNVVERRALMDLNKNPMGLALLAGSPEAWATFMADRSPLFKSLAARLINAGKERVPQAVGAAVGAGVGGQSGTPPRSGLETLGR